MTCLSLKKYYTVFALNVSVPEDGHAPLKKIKPPGKETRRFEDLWR